MYHRQFRPLYNLRKIKCMFILPKEVMELPEKERNEWLKKFGELHKRKMIDRGVLTLDDYEKEGWTH